MKPDVRLFLAAILAPIVGGSSSGPIVDLDYSSYQGYHETATGLNVWKGCVHTPLSVYLTRTQQILKLTCAAFGMHRLQSGTCDGNLPSLLPRIIARSLPLWTNLPCVPSRVLQVHLPSMVSTQALVTRIVYS